MVFMTASKSAWNAKEIPLNSMIPFWMMEIVEIPVFASGIYRTTCALAVISRTMKNETEPPYIKNSQAFQEATAEVGSRAREKRAWRI